MNRADQREGCHSLSAPVAECEAWTWLVIHRERKGGGRGSLGSVWGSCVPPPKGTMSHTDPSAHTPTLASAPVSLSRLHGFLYTQSCAAVPVVSFWNVVITPKRNPASTSRNSPFPS